MDRTNALRLLSPKYAGVILLEDAGCEHDRIAQMLDLDLSAVAPLARVARAKLAALQRLDDDPPRLRQ